MASMLEPLAGAKFCSCLRCLPKQVAGAGSIHMTHGHAVLCCGCFLVLVCSELP